MASTHDSTVPIGSVALLCLRFICIVLRETLFYYESPAELPEPLWKQLYNGFYPLPRADGQQQLK